MNKRLSLLLRTLAIGIGCLFAVFSSAPVLAQVFPDATIDSVTQLEGDAGVTAFIFTVSLDVTPTAGTATYSLATSDGTAIAPGDYTADSFNLTFPNGSPTTQTVTVLVNGDTAVEPDEVFSVDLLSATSGTIGNPSSGTGTILNDDFVCGDGNLDPGEGCDDGNTTSGDGCSATCMVEVPTLPEWAAIVMAVALLSVAILLLRRRNRLV